MELIDWIIIILTWMIGLVSHYLKKIVELRKENESITIRSYWIEHPHQTLLSLTLGIGTALALLGVDQLNSVTAFACAWIGNSIADILGSRLKS